MIIKPPVIIKPPRPPVFDPGSDMMPSAITVVPDYFPDGLADKVGAVVAGLQAAIQPVQSNGLNGHAESVVAARNRLVAVLKNPAFTAAKEAWVGGSGGPGIVVSLLRREFQQAATGISTIERSTALGGAAITESLMATALSTTGVRYTRTRDLPGEPGVVVGHRTLPGYAGPALTTLQRGFLRLFCELIVGGRERDLRPLLLRGECALGLRDFDTALTHYQKILSSPIGETRQRQCAAIRAAQALADRGDATYRGAFAPTQELRDAARADYDAASAMLRAHRVPADDPVSKEIRTRTELQRAKLDARLNVLGLNDSFVPVQRYTVLEEVAREHIAAAKASADAFAAALEKADDLVGQTMDLTADRKAEEKTAAIADIQAENASIETDKIEDQLAFIESRLGFLSLDNLGGLVDAFGSAVRGYEAGMSLNNPIMGQFTGGAGIAGNVVGWLAQRAELEHQKRMAELDLEIAQNQEKIVELQKQLSADRTAYLTHKLQFLTDKRLNADFLYALAEVRERRAERELEVAVVLSYLFERALVFFLGLTESDGAVRHIGFDYRDRPSGIFDAAPALDESFRKVVALKAGLNMKRIGDFEEQVSLREHYPLQFFRLLQDGDMEFSYTLYQLSKVRPATHQLRLWDVGVEVKGLVPPGGFRGTLTHSGQFVVRSKSATLAKTTTRLVPTDEELTSAIEEQQARGTSAVAVGGVLYYSLPPSVLDLSQDTQFVSEPPQNLTLKTFEGYAPTGVWKLHIDNIGELDVNDIVLHFAIVNPQSDELRLAPRVRQLRRAYEAELAAAAGPEGDLLDRVSVFSLRQEFPDVFVDLESGRGTLVLGEDSFDSSLTNLQCKAVIAQAVDPNGRGRAGIAVRIDRGDVGFTLDRITRSDGFTEDLDLPVETLPRDEHFPVLGQWQIRLPQRGQFGQLGDLRLFLMYSYEEV